MRNDENEGYCFEVRVFEDVFLQHPGTAYFFNPRFLFTQKGKKKRKRSLH